MISSMSKDCIPHNHLSLVAKLRLSILICMHKPTNHYDLMLYCILMQLSVYMDESLGFNQVHNMLCVDVHHSVEIDLDSVQTFSFELSCYLCM